MQKKQLEMQNKFLNKKQRFKMKSTVESSQPTAHTK